MKPDTRNIGLLMVTLVAVSVGATYLVVGGITTDNELDHASTAGLLFGNVQVKVIDKETGDITAYRQSDNHIVQHGMAIIAAQVFNDTRGSTNPAEGGGYGNANALVNFTGTGFPNGVGTVKYMDIGNASQLTDPPGFANITLGAALKDSKPSSGAWPDCDREVAIINNQSAAESAPASGFAEINITAIATFDGTTCASGQIQEAGIWTDDNSSATQKGLMFARNVFGAVDLTTSDSLELTWTFTFTDS